MGPGNGEVLDQEVVDVDEVIGGVLIIERKSVWSPKCDRGTASPPQASVLPPVHIHLESIDLAPRMRLRPPRVGVARGGCDSQATRICPPESEVAAIL